MKLRNWRRGFLYVSLIITFILIAILRSYSNQKGKNTSSPNVIVIFADDMGYGDVKAYNPESNISTPNLDKLVHEGISFTDAHTSSAVCTPSRYSLLTGRYPWRSWMKYSVFNGYEGPALLKDGQQTLGTLFQNAGYNTAIIGKWHLGVEWQPKKPGTAAKFGNVDYTKPVLNTPKQHGFDYSYVLSASLDFSPYVFIENNTVLGPVDTIINENSFPAFYRRAESTKSFRHEAVLDHTLDKSKRFISENAEKGKPFFLYYPLTAPHMPILPHPRFRGKSTAGWYGDFVLQVDWTVGEVLNTLEKAGITNNTIVIFSSDNGSFMYKIGENMPDHKDSITIGGYRPETHKANWNWRGIKSDIYESGHRVPLMISWPGKLTPQKIKNTVCLTDITATLSELLNLKADPKQMEDSYSLVPLFNNKKFNREAVIHQSGRGALAIRKGDYKLILCSGSGGREVPAGFPFIGPFQLYNLANDPYETVNLIDKEKLIAADLEKDFYRIVGSDLSLKDIEMLKKVND